MALSSAMQNPFTAISLKGSVMKVLTLLVVVLWSFSANAAAPTAIDTGTCGEIRSLIQAQTGILAAPDTALLQKIGINSQCQFSSAEVYRAAYGDKPMPKTTDSVRQRRHHDDD